MIWICYWIKEKRMKKLILLSVVLLIFAGCGSPAANVGAGAGLGGALTHTFMGAKADLKQREEQLIEAYNQGVEIGMEREDLDAIKQQIRDTQLGRHAVGAGEHLFNVDWNDPKQTGGAIGLISSLALLWLNRKKLKSTSKELEGKDAAINKFCGTNEPTKAKELHDLVKAKTGT